MVTWHEPLIWKVPAMIRGSKAAVLVSATLLALAGLAKVAPGKVGLYSGGDVEPRASRTARRLVWAAVLAGLLAAGATSGVRAQQPTSPAQPAANASGWTFNVAPYVWFASLNATANLNLPPATGGGTVTSTTSVGFGELLTHINFATMVAADAQYDRFSVLTDFLYMNLSGAPTQFKSVNFARHPNIPISGSRESSQGLNLSAPIWTLAGGYTLLKGDWGNFDVIAGFRYLAINLGINYSLGLTITGPEGGSEKFGGVGGVSGSANIWNGIGGFRGRVRLGDTGLFIPYYFDGGSGGSKLTWQIASGIGYQTSWADLSLTYRYLSFQQSNGAKLEHLWIKGPMIMADFRF